jgi:hypothetical protein
MEPVLELEKIELSFLPHFQNKLRSISAHNTNNKQTQNTEGDAEDKKAKLVLNSIKFRKNNN